MDIRPARLLTSDPAWLSVNIDITNSMPEGPSLDTCLDLARAARQGSNFAEAEKYYTKALEHDPSLVEAWVGKGEACGMQSSTANIRLSEAVVSFSRAIAATPRGARSETERMCADIASNLAINSFLSIHNYILDYYNCKHVLGKTEWNQYFDISKLILENLDTITGWTPGQPGLYLYIERICRLIMEGVPYISEGGQRCYFPEGTDKELIQERYNFAIAKLRELRPEYEPKPVVPKKEEALCFIVTATLGSSDHPWVIVLRKFRDEVLVTNQLGRAAVEFYGRVGPIGARLIRSRPALRVAALFIVVLPAVTCVKLIYGKSLNVRQS